MGTKKVMGSKEQLLDEVITTPSISAACDKLRIPSPVLRGWIDTDKVFTRTLALYVEWGREHINDIADEQLIARIRKGDLPAIKHWQKYNDTRYAPRKPVPPPRTEPQTTHFIFETVPAFPLIPQDESVVLEEIGAGIEERPRQIYRLKQPLKRG